LAKPLANFVYNQIITRIIKGEYCPNMRLTERDLASSLSVSRVPVREAINRLQLESWVSRDENSNVYVRQFSTDDVREIFQLREGIEGIAAREAGENIQPDQLEQLETELKILNQHVDTSSKSSTTVKEEDYRQSDRQFHHIIIDACGNERIKSIFTTVILQSRCFFFVTKAASILGITFHDTRPLIPHKDIYSAIKSGDGNNAESVMREHIRSGYEAIIRVKSVLGIE
jgi:DNA-binding GntR family transcriptional regulator